MRGAIAFGLVVMIGVGVSASCEKQAAPPPPAPAAAPPPPPPPPPAAPVDAAVRPKMVAPTDGLSLADRMAKRQAEEKKVADQLAGEEKKRLLTYDKTKLPIHQQVFASITKVRAAFTKAKSKEDVAKIQLAQQKVIDATGKKMMTIDPKGGQSNVVTDYDVMLDALSRGYPDALMGSFDGDKKGLDEVNAELDKRSKKIETWLAEVKAFKK
jgi:type IV secretory pathway VirB10-like protein